MSRINTCLWSSILTLLLLAAGCTTVGPGGSGTETTTGIMGSVVNENGIPQAKVQVQLFPLNYNPVNDTTKIIVDTTDSLGRYQFMNINAGQYSVSGLHIQNRLRALVNDIRVSINDTTTALTGILRVPGKIKVGVPSGQNNNDEYMYIPGTSIFTYIKNNSDYSILDSVPAELISKIVLSSKSDTTSYILNRDINVRSGDTTVIPLALWNHAESIILNTSSTGANISSTIVNFPVLVRLNSSNFDFAQASTDGADIRFTKTDNTPLRYEIERWDVNLQRAEIWVNVDTIYGNNNTQTIIMYWGNHAAVSGSNSTAVFDTSAGFQGVWHLGNSGATYTDATVNAYNGISAGTTTPSIRDGIIGQCAGFDGLSSFITMPGTADSKINFQQDGNYTVSVWVNVDTLDGVSHCIVSKGFEQYYLRFTYISTTIPYTTPLWEFVEFSEIDKWRTSNAIATARQWVLLTGVHQGSRQLLYCNGTLVDSTTDTWFNTVSRNTTNDLSIGRFMNSVTLPVLEGYCYFKGGIDEIRIVSTSQSADWVKLCYMNQRSDDQLVIFTKVIR